MTINKLAQHLNLGNLLEPAVMLAGAGLHKIWHFKTSIGEYVAKEINPHVVEKEFFFEEYERSECIADFFKCNKIPAVAALKFGEHYLHQQDGSWFIVYPYVAGHVLTPEHITESHAAMIGNLFAQMHHLHGDLFKEELTVRYDLFDSAHWQKLIRRTDDKTLKNLEHAILAWNKKYQSAIPQLNKNLVVTHCDMHYLNVLWNQECSPHIID